MRMNIRGPASSGESSSRQAGPQMLPRLRPGLQGRGRASFLCVFVVILSSGFLGAASKLNVLLISIDTLRSDHLGCYGYSQKTPSIDAFAAQSVLFENAISQVPLTLPSHCTILTGLYPEQHGVLNNEAFVLPERLTTLAELFHRNGYATGAVVGSFSLDSTFGINQGFDFFDDQIGSGHDAEANRYVERKAETVWSHGKEWLLRQTGPWFCFLHFFDPHTGYNPPQPYPQTYDGEIAYTDSVVGRALQSIDLSTTIVVLLSDHGESLGEHGESSHGVFLYDATLKVPLLIRAPGLATRRVRSQVRLVDVAPTIAALAHLQQPPVFSGESLAPLLHGAEKQLLAYSETYYTSLLMGWAPLHAVRSNTAKWIEAPKPELYDLLRDPHEKTNLADSKPVPDPFRAEWTKHQKRAANSAAADIDPETREKLASLGYVTGSSGSTPNTGPDPKDGIAVWNQIEEAVALAQSGDLEKSRALFLEALKKQPDNVIALKFLANVLRKNGDDKEAIPYLKTALQSSLHQDETRLDLARTYYDTGDFAGALREASMLTAKNPRNAEALSLQAKTLARLQKDQEALSAYEALSRLRALTEDEALQAAGICLTNKNLDCAEKYFAAGMAANKDHPVEEARGLALIDAVRKNWDGAIRNFLKAGDCKSAANLLLNTKSTTVLEEFHHQCD